MELEIATKVEEEIATLTLKGRVTTQSSPDLEKAIGAVLKDSKKVILECTGLEYVSSAGLRVLKKTYLWTQSHGREVEMINVGEVVMEILDMVGLKESLTKE